MLGGHGALHRGHEINLVRVTGSAQDGAGGRVDQKCPPALERGAVAADPVDLLVFGVTGDGTGRLSAAAWFPGLAGAREPEQW